MGVSLRWWSPFSKLSLFRISRSSSSKPVVRFSSRFEVSSGSGILLDKGVLGRAESKDTVRSLIPLITQHPGVVTWYACGPTVYDSSHIGHASSYIRLDIIRRILERQGLTVLQVMGITDIDDKIIARSNQLGIAWNELGKKYELEFLNNLTKLDVKLPHVKARVSDFVPHIIKFVTDLVDSGVAYPTSDGSVYFDTEKYGAYNKFRMADTESVLEEEPHSEKKNRRDFALWKGYKPGEPHWKTNWGQGRPGWHIECSVMASHFFGPKLDIHSGGKDLIFPHHENEEAQCCAKFGNPQWVSHWIHTGHLVLRNDVKMSKSLGNTITIQDFLNHNSSATLRMMCMLSMYNQTIEYSEEYKNHAIAVLRKLESFIGNCNSLLSGQCSAQQAQGSETLLWEKLFSSKTEVQSLLATNFNVPKSLRIVQDLISDFYHNVEIVPNSNTPVDMGLIFACKQFVEGFLELMGISGENAETSQNESLFEPVLTELLSLRKSVRAYSLALDENDKVLRKQKMQERQQLTEACDDVRKNLKALGIEIKDSGQVSSWSMHRSFG